jgi:hypothetical protein
MALLIAGSIVGGGLAAWVVGVAVTALVGALCVVETESVRRASRKGEREASAVG